jgi:hypothetical protein
MYCLFYQVLDDIRKNAINIYTFPECDCNIEEEYHLFMYCPFYQVLDDIRKNDINIYTAGVMKILLKWASLNIGNQQFIYNLLSFVFIL